MSSQSYLLKPAVLPESVLAEIFDSSERSATIVAAATIDDQLKRKLQHVLQPCDNPARDPLFDIGESPLSSFNAKIILAERLRIIEPEFARLLHRVRDIRNKYAHRPAFTDTSVRDMCDSLVRDFFFGAVDAGSLGPEVEMPKGPDVIGTYSLPGEPVAKMVERGATQQEVNFRMLLIALIGNLADHSFDEVGASLIQITYFFLTKDNGIRAIDRIALSYFEPRKAAAVTA
jgi:hypothetical protein